MLIYYVLKLTVYLVLELEQYPVPKVQDLFEKLLGREKYSKLDVSHAHQQATLKETSKQYLPTNTHKGLLRVKSPIFSVFSSLAIFPLCTHK